MAPTPQKVSICRQVSDNTDANLPAGERIVISGMSGLYPKARNVKELANILYSKINPVTSNSSRWIFNHSELTGYTGKVPDLNSFDAQFFRVHYLLGNNMDVICRKILEQAYMAIYDAGVNPEQLGGKKVAVYIGSGVSEHEKVAMYLVQKFTEYGLVLLGCNKAMYANRISYWLNAKGPSMSVDQESCSSTEAIELACQAILQGECESAIVGGTNLCLHPHSLIHYGRLLKLNKDGKTKSFDENADGSVKSEAINVLFLQKAKDARRVYAEIVSVKSEFRTLPQDKPGPRYGLYRHPSDSIEFLNQFYKECNVSPQAVQYVEGIGSAIPDADKAELEAYEQVFCGDRNNPLLVGSIMSNIGNVEAASGITAVTKILLAYHTGVLAGNLHCEKPRRDVEALRDGRMVIVNDHVPFNHGYAAINGLSVTGSSAHLLLKGHYKAKDLHRYKSAIPHLVLISARQETAVITILKDLKSRPVDPEEIALLHNVHATKISGHLGRGFTILDMNKENKTVSLSEKASYIDYVKRPLWFVYSGMGSQYNRMGIDLMRIPIFAAAIERCHRALQPKGIDIVHIITSSDKTIFDNILHSFVGIAAIQIGLTDVLKELGIVPDKIIGHSVGELGCAYADECFTAEEMILSAYYRGLVSVQTPLIRGSMAAVGIGYEQIQPMCPPEIEVACHNSSDSCTISGPVDIMQEFVASLINNNIFAKEVPCSNIAYHSRYIADAGPGLLKYLKEVIRTPKMRSERWVSTSVPMNKWEEPSAKYSSAEYHTNNLLSTVLFEETSRVIPSNAILVEIAPHGLLQGILKRSLPTSCSNIPLTRRGCQDNAVHFLEAIGKLYIEGLNPNIQCLYPKIEFPVSTGTPMLSHLVEWAHNDKWSIPLYLSPTSTTASAATNIVTIHDEEHKYLRGHVIGGQILYPFSAVLVAVWDMLAMIQGVPKRRLAVQFRDVMLYAQPIMHDRRHLRLKISLKRGIGRFEVMDDVDSKVASGFIIKDEKKGNKILDDAVASQSSDITSREIYNYFHNRGFSYRDSFKSIHDTNSSLTEARIIWHGNWVTFIDGMFQLNNLRHSHDSHSHPNFISKLCIDPDEQDTFEDTLRTATVLETYNLIKCGGVVMENIIFKDLPIPAGDTTMMRGLKFVPHFASDLFDFETILQVYFQIVAENIGTRPINILGIYKDQSTLTKFHQIKCIFEDIPDITTKYTWINSSNIVNEPKQTFSQVSLLLICDLATDDCISQLLHEVVEQNTFIINIRNSVNNITNVSRPSALYQVVCDHSTGSALAIELARWRPINRSAFMSVISIHSPTDFGLLIQEINCLLPHQNLIIMTTYPAVPGLKDIFDQYKNKSGCNIRIVMNDNDDKEFADDDLFNADLSVKVVKNGMFGGEYYVPLNNVCNIKDNVTLQSSLIGHKETLQWVQAPLQKNTGVSVKVHYAALNNFDTKRLTGLISLDTSCKGYGMDFSGVTESGARVMGLVECGAVSTIIKAHPDFLWPVPDHWSLEDAVTVPFAYCLAYYCLSIKFQLYPGSSVFIYGGAGGLGQAIISLALANRCEVFIAVGDNRKKQFLLQMFPGLKAENIGNSRNLTSCDLVLNVTNGKRVDVVISTVNVELKTLSLRCVAQLGTIIDLGQISSTENFDYGMSNLDEERSYRIINFFSIFNEIENNTMKKLQRLVSEGIVKGWVKPLSRIVYASENVSRAFHLMRDNNHRGRVLLNLQQTNIDALHVQPRLQCSTEKLHIIISQHGGFGQHMADMLISRGVRKIFLNLPIFPEDFKLKMRQWKRQGVQVSCEYRDAFDVSGMFADDWIISPEQVEGVYILRTIKHRSISERNDFVNTINKITRKTFPGLKFFAVINATGSAGDETCMYRNTDQFAVTMLNLPELKEVNSNDTRDGMSLRDAVNSIENAITSGEFVLSAHVVSTPPVSLMKQLLSVAGLKVSQDIKGKTTLLDLGVDLTKANIVSVYLRNTYNIFYTPEEIQVLTAERIEYIEETLTRTLFKTDKRLSEIFTCVDTDEIGATVEMVFMPTLTRSATGDYNDMSLPYLCIVPGLEGHYGRFRTLCEGLKLPAVVLQPDIDRPHETIPEMARRYVQIISKTARPNKHFYLLGYESGVHVVLEMASMLEEKGFTTLVFCIGTPDEVNIEIKEHLKGLETNEALQDALLRHMFIMMSKSPTDELEVALKRVVSWQEKLDIAVYTLLGKVSHSAQYARQLIMAAYERLVSLLKYKVKVQALHSQLILMQPVASSREQEIDLQRYSKQPVICYELQAPLSQAADDLRCAAIVNAHLDVDILEKFEKENRCESYVLDSNQIRVMPLE